MLIRLWAPDAHREGWELAGQRVKSIEARYASTLTYADTGRGSPLESRNDLTHTAYKFGCALVSIGMMRPVLLM